MRISKIKRYYMHGGCRKIIGPTRRKHFAHRDGIRNMRGNNKTYWSESPKLKK